MYSAHNSNTFLSYFNQIDKYLSYILWLKKYVPYHERVTMVATGKISISRFVQKVEDKLRYFWDLRNQLVHGFRLDNKHYLVVSDHALEQISALHDELTKPRLATELAHKPLIAQTIDSLEILVQQLTENKISYLPVSHEDRFTWVLWFQDVLARLNLDKKVDISELTVWDIDVSSYVEYRFVDKQTNIYQVQDLLSQKDVEVVLITEDGTADSDIVGMISALDKTTYK